MITQLDRQLERNNHNKKLQNMFNNSKPKAYIVHPKAFRSGLRLLTIKKTRIMRVDETKLKQFSFAGIWRRIQVNQHQCWRQWIQKGSLSASDVSSCPSYTCVSHAGSRVHHVHGHALPPSSSRLSHGILGWRTVSTLYVSEVCPGMEQILADKEVYRTRQT